MYRIGCHIGVLFDFIHTTPPLVRFFERLGHRRYKSDFIDPQLGARTPMSLVLQDIKHLETCHSPFLNIARRYENGSDSAQWFQKAFLQGEKAIVNATANGNSLGC